MTSYAIIKNGLCDNVIVSGADFAATIGAVPLPNGFGIGDTFDGTTWIKKPLPKPEPQGKTLEDEVTELKQLVADLASLQLEV